MVNLIFGQEHSPSTPHHVLVWGKAESIISCCKRYGAAWIQDELEDRLGWSIKQDVSLGRFWRYWWKDDDALVLQARRRRKTSQGWMNDSGVDPLSSSLLLCVRADVRANGSHETVWVVYTRFGLKLVLDEICNEHVKRGYWKGAPPLVNPFGIWFYNAQLLALSIMIQCTTLCIAVLVALPLAK